MPINWRHESEQSLTRNLCHLFWDTQKQQQQQQVQLATRSISYTRKLHNGFAVCTLAARLVCAANSSHLFRARCLIEALYLTAYGRFHLLDCLPACLAAFLIEARRRRRRRRRLTSGKSRQWWCKVTWHRSTKRPPRLHRLSPKQTDWRFP